jgi:hypothetical protein
MSSDALPSESLSRGAGEEIGVVDKLTALGHHIVRFAQGDDIARVEAEGCILTAPVWKNSRLRFGSADFKQRVLHVTTNMNIYFTDGLNTTEVHNLKDFTGCAVDSDGKNFVLEYWSKFRLRRTSVEVRLDQGSTHFVVLVDAMAKRRGVLVQHAYVLGPAPRSQEKVQLKVGSLMFRIEKDMQIAAAFALLSFLSPETVKDMEDFRSLADARKIDIVDDRVRASDLVVLLQWDMSTDCSSAASSSTGDVCTEECL